ncbi:M1 family metallopeptidase [Shewanella cyperi]|uniref:Aminopeptidase N n=1 Tax=Shewanella cyperi TaxID=2814292 RepID=A0A974XHV7_9GAMM|nr:M1 family metallopeptidase [Shewanella cyperi]QSX28675.1 M1 family metallopeptidase [Shewanella cyperi]
MNNFKTITGCLAALLALSLPLSVSATPALPSATPTASESQASAPASTSISANDRLTFANYHEVSVSHIDMDLSLDFEQQRIEGQVELSLDWHSDSRHLLLDSRGLDIHSVQALNSDGQWHQAQFSLGAHHGVMGEPVEIRLNARETKVRINYRSAEVASGLQWLSAAQTQGKSQPFMFSQNQAIHARSWLPLQDTPAVRSTFSARISAPEGITVVMGAERTEAVDGVTVFNMPQAIPSYLIALAAGDLHYAAFDERSGVWAEPAMLAKAKAEFEQTPEMITIASKRYGDYRWGRYDLLILPPSFPFGGMENPRLSFITPTVIAGDKSLVSLIAHELAHSWSGNLVTNASWDDLWLNEGFTSYVENRIMEDLYGRERALMEQSIAVGELKEEAAGLDSADTRLEIDLGQRDPDDAFNSIPYTKGQQFLVFLERAFGREPFDTFLKGYFSSHAFVSIDRQEFRRYLNSELLNRFPGRVTNAEIETWLQGEGTGPLLANPADKAFDKLDKEAALWRSGKLKASDIDTVGWTVHHWLHLLNNLPRDLSHPQLAELDTHFGLSQQGNSEIAFSWFKLALACGYYEVKPELGAYLEHIGRRRLVVPLYEALAASSEKAWARDIFAKAKPGYHPVTVASIEKLLR